MSPSTSLCGGNKQLIVNQEAGNQVFYSVRDPIIIVEVLNLMRIPRSIECLRAR